MSSGKKRRTRSESGVLARLERSLWLRVVLLLLFVLAAWWMVWRGSEGTVFEGNPVHGGLVGMVLAVSAVLMFRVSYEQVALRTGRVTLLFGGILLHIFLVKSVDAWLQANEVAAMFRFLLVPFAFAPMIHTVLLGRGLGIFSTVYVSAFGTLLVPGEDALTYLAVSMLCGLVVVAAADRVRRRVQLLRAGMYAGATALAVVMLVVSFALLLLINLLQAWARRRQGGH